MGEFEELKGISGNLKMEMNGNKKTFFKIIFFYYFGINLSKLSKIARIVRKTNLY